MEFRFGVIQNSVLPHLLKRNALSLKNVMQSCERQLNIAKLPSGFVTGVD